MWRSAGRIHSWSPLEITQVSPVPRHEHRTQRQRDSKWPAVEEAQGKSFSSTKDCEQTHDVLSQRIYRGALQVVFCKSHKLSSSKHGTFYKTGKTTTWPQLTSEKLLLEAHYDSVPKNWPNPLFTKCRFHTSINNFAHGRILLITMFLYYLLLI